MSEEAFYVGRSVCGTSESEARFIAEYVQDRQAYARALYAISEPVEEHPVDDLPWNSDGYDL